VAESSLEAQRIRLLNGIAPLVARSGAETTVVFDAATSESRPPVNPPRGVKVIFSALGVIADDVIRDLVDAEPQGRMVVVVTSDLEIVDDVRRAGARTVASDALIGVLTR
jgi:predicted RNA-binding protein with PIN domain